MAKPIQARWKISPARLVPALTSLLLWALAGPVVAQEVLPDLTYKLTALNPRPPAADFALKDLDGKIQRLSDYKGKVVLINFWATWCPPCRREMPSMERAYLKLKDQPFMMLALNQYESFDLVFTFTGQLEPSPTFPILFDTDLSASKRWKVPGLPASFIVDKQGRVAYRAIGGREFDHPEIEKRIRALIAE